MCAQELVRCIFRPLHTLAALTMRCEVLCSRGHRFQTPEMGVGRAPGAAATERARPGAPIRRSSMMLRYKLVKNRCLLDDLQQWRCIAANGRESAQQGVQPGTRGGARAHARATMLLLARSNIIITGILHLSIATDVWINTRHSHRSAEIHLTPQAGGREPERDAEHRHRRVFAEDRHFES
jgi:hypothetical protein